jgi:hypothetical protein
MAVTNKKNTLLNGFVKLVVCLLIFSYLLVTLTLGVIGPVEVICILGLFFRLTFVVDDSLPTWKFFVGLISYSVAFWGISNSSSMILAVTLGSVFFLDCLQLVSSRSNR